MPVWRVIFVVAVGLSTSGCLFSAYQIASLTVSGISYMVSGRSVGDHALSMAMAQDCATHRILEGADICVDFPQDDTDTLLAAALAPGFPEYDNALGDSSDAVGGEIVAAVPTLLAAEPVADGFVGAVAPKSAIDRHIIPASMAVPRLDDEVFPADAAPPKPAVSKDLNLDALLPASGPAPGQSITRLPRPLPTNTGIADVARAAPRVTGPKIYLVIGSFQNSDNAEKLGKQHSDINTAVMTLESSGQKMYRVVAGPLDDSGLGHARGRFLKAGIRNTWAVRLCQEDLALPPCRESVMQQAQLPGR